MRQSKSDANLINSQLQQRGTLSNKKRNVKQAAKKKVTVQQELKLLVQRTTLNYVAAVVWAADAINWAQGQINLRCPNHARSWFVNEYDYAWNENHFKPQWVGQPLIWNNQPTNYKKFKNL